MKKKNSKRESKATTARSDCINILIVDDNARFVEAVMEYLASFKQLRIIGSATNGLEAIERTKKLLPHLILMDIAMPHMNGLQATQAIKRLASAPRIFILTMHESSEYEHAAKIAGADAFIHKGDFISLLLPMMQSYYPQHFCTKSASG